MPAMNPEALVQLARILGREELCGRLGLDEGAIPGPLTPAQAEALQRLVEERASDIVRALLEEAAACDDVIDSKSAMMYLEDRLAFLGELLTEETRQRVRKGFAEHASRWD